MADRGRREPPRAQGRRRARRARGVGGGVAAVGQLAAGDGDRPRDPLRRRRLSRLALPRQCDHRERGRSQSLSRQRGGISAQWWPAAPRRSHRPARLRGDPARRRREWAGCALSRPHRGSGRRGHGGERGPDHDGRPRDLQRHRARAGANDVPGRDDHGDGAGERGRHAHRPDAQHSQRLRSRGVGLRHGAHDPPDGGGIGHRLRGLGALHGRPRLRRCAGAVADEHGVRRRTPRRD